MVVVATVVAILIVVHGVVATAVAVVAGVGCDGAVSVVFSRQVVLVLVPVVAVVAIVNVWLPLWLSVLLRPFP